MAKEQAVKTLAEIDFENRWKAAQAEIEAVCQKHNVVLAPAIDYQWNGARPYLRWIDAPKSKIVPPVN